MGEIIEFEKAAEAFRRKKFEIDFATITQCAKAEPIAMRLAAAEHVRRISATDILTSGELSAGFMFDDERMPLINSQRGIFKPRSMEQLLSVRTI